jgi:lysophospholipase L1-like esterase
MGVAMGSGKNVAFYRQMKALFGSSIVGYWPLYDASGTAPIDVSGNGCTGTIKGVVWQNAAGPDGKGMPYFDGVNAAMHITSTPLNALLNLDEISYMAFAKPHNVSAWLDLQVRYLMFLYTNGDNYMYLRKSDGNNNLELCHRTGGASTTKVYTTLGPSHPFMVGITASKSGNATNFYYNGIQINSGTVPNAWNGTGANTTKPIGSSAFNPVGVAWIGWISHLLLLNRAATTSEMRSYFKSYRRGVKIVSVLGDSISAEYNTWPARLEDGGRYAVSDHAVGGHTIMANMDAQTVGAATDNADIIIIALGTNDNEAGDMAALQAEYAENIAELKLSNPNATIYAMNVLPRFDGSARTNIRAAIAAACAAQGVACWDTTTDPWLTSAADTLDNVHPTAAGHAKIVARVIAKLN